MRVLVTGGASGIGRAIATRFVADGARVAVLDRDKTALDALITTLPGLDSAIAADVTAEESVDAAFAELDQRWGGLDVLFNNAGISIRESFLEASLDNWNRVMAVNMTGVFLMAQRAARRMARDRDGVIVNTGSVSGMVGMPGYAGYNASKAGVIALTKTIALELAPAIRVNCICPGYVLTPMQEAEYTPEMIQECAAKVPLNRLGMPAEIAALGAYLVSSEARFVTGQSFVIDGGESAGGLASG